MAHVVLVIVALGLEEEVPGLAAGHGHAPGQQACQRDVHEEHRIGHDEGAGRDEVQALVHQAVMIEAVIVPALLGKLGAKARVALLVLKAKFTNLRHHAFSFFPMRTSEKWLKGGSGRFSISSTSKRVAIQSV